MQLRPQLQIQAIIKALTEDVLPALDQSNQLAMQSAHLAIGTLTVIAQHLPLEYRYDCDELSRLIDSADVLLGQIKGAQQTNAVANPLAEASRAGTEVLNRARAEPAEIVDAVRRLRSAAAQAVRAAYLEGTETIQAGIEKTVLSLSKHQLLRDRSWLLAQGWEPDPKLVPAIDALLAPIG